MDNSGSPMKARFLRRAGSVLRRRARQDRYALVLALLLANYSWGALPPTGTAGGACRLALFLLTLLLAVRTSRVPRGTARLVLALTTGGTLAVAVLLLAGAGVVGLGVLDAWMSVLMLVTVLVIVRRVLAHEVVTVNTILGALSAYLLIGLMFAAIYGAVAKLGPTPFFSNNEPAGADVVQYFSFTTLTTLGYGDFTAATNAGRSLAVLEALIGQTFLVTLVARLVSAFRSPSDTR